MHGLPAEWRRHPFRSTLRIAASFFRPSRSAVVHVGPVLMNADLSTPFGLGLYRYGCWDETLQTVVDLLNPGDTFVDCGANQGLFSMIAAATVGPSGRVIAFEPVAKSVAALGKNISLNGFANVLVLPVALADTVGQRSFFVTEGGGGTSSFVLDEGDEVMVPVTTLDSSLDDEKVRVVKVDVEGAEVALLKGANKLLEGDSAWIIEIEAKHLVRNGTSVEELVQLLSSTGRVGRPLSPPNWLFAFERDRIGQKRNQRAAVAEAPTTPERVATAAPVHRD